MSYHDTRQALVTQLTNATIANISANDIATENSDFDPAGKELWIAFYFIPATSDMMGKTPASSDEQRGVFQVSVFTALNSGNYDLKQLQTIDSILSAFQYNSGTVYNNQKVDILESTVNNGTENESWFKRDISISYLTFSSR